MKTKERLNSERLVSVFNQDELSSIMTAMAGYITMKRKQGRSTGTDSVAFNKIVDALLMSNYMNAEVVNTNKGEVWGAAEYKMSEQYEAMYESDVRAHS